MQTLSEFYKDWSPGIIQLARIVGAQFESAQNMSRFLALEAVLRSEVDTACRAFATKPDAQPCIPSTPEVAYLLHHRLLSGIEFAQFLDHCGLGNDQMEVEGWIEFLLIHSWGEYLVHGWRARFSKIYGTSTEN